VQGGLARSLSVGLGLSSRLSGISLRRTLSSFRRARASRRAALPRGDRGREASRGPAHPLGAACAGRPISAARSRHLGVH